MLRGLGVLVLVSALALAGCVQAPDGVDAASIEGAGDAASRLVSFTASGLVPLAPAFSGLDVRISDVGYDGPEPSMGVTSDGTIWITAGEQELARSSDHGRTWELVTTGSAVTAPKANLDPWMWVDPWTDRIINAPLYVACTWMTWSDDGGESWDGFNPVTGCAQGIPAHDHQKLTSGPPAEGVTVTGYENVLYYSYNSFRGEGTWIQQSYDGGKTFTLGQAVHPDSCHSGIAGPVAVGDDGVAYSPKPTCDGIEIAVTKDSGATWSLVSVEDVGTIDALAHMTDAAVDKSLNAYAVWTGEDGLPYLTRSTDSGATFSKPIRVSPPGVTSTTHNVVTAGESGRVAVAYYGTRADTSEWEDKSAQSAPPETVWNLYLTMTEDALADEPVWTTVQVTPDEDPVQIGCIWLSGGSNACRNLLDFIDMVQLDGRVYIAYADGCDACKSASESTGRAATVAIVERGPSLLGGLLEPLGLEVPATAAEPEEGRLLADLRLR